MNQPIFLENYTSPQTRELLASLEMVLIPVGAHEQHGPALPVSTDTITATAMSSRLAELLGDRVAVAPTIPWGVSWHHFGKPGTISLRESTLIDIVTDQIDSLHKQGVNRFVLVNSHGGNNPALALAVERAKRDLGVPLAVSVYAYSMLADAARQIMGESAIGHAGGDEAAVILALRPELVDADQLVASQQQPELLRAKQSVLKWGGAMPTMMHHMSPSGATGDASSATAEYGTAILDMAIANLRDMCQQLLDLDLTLLQE